MRGVSDRRSIHMHVVALLNDTVGTLAAGRHQCPDTLLSIILGTGERRFAFGEAIRQWKLVGLRPCDFFMRDAVCVARCRHQRSVHRAYERHWEAA
jgi:hypothetical protein